MLTVATSRVDAGEVVEHFSLRMTKAGGDVDLRTNKFDIEVKGKVETPALIEASLEKLVNFEPGERLKAIAYRQNQTISKEQAGAFDKFPDVQHLPY